MGFVLGPPGARPGATGLQVWKPDGWGPLTGLGGQGLLTRGNQALLEDFHNKSWMNGWTEQQRRGRRNKSPSGLVLAQKVQSTGSYQWSYAGNHTVVRSLTRVSRILGPSTANQQRGIEPTAPEPTAPEPGSLPGAGSLLLTQQQQLDLPGRLLSVVPQVPVDHLASLHRRLVLRAQRASHLQSQAV